ncbi:MAG: hypothetical protein KA313_03600 [Pseudarcicella sp.]|nr:hypothetical protein [Pseudarcicella sp.]MBP6410159.1 hypothetical protein [Pseudarcicella sp.]
MNHSENQLNEALRKALSDKFENFEVAPSAASEKKIFAQIVSKSPFWIGRNFVFTAMFILSGSFFYTNTEKVNAKNSALKVFNTQIKSNSKNTLSNLKSNFYELAKLSNKVSLTNNQQSIVIDRNFAAKTLYNHQNLERGANFSAKNLNNIQSETNKNAKVSPLNKSNYTGNSNSVISNDFALNNSATENIKVRQNLIIDSDAQSDKLAEEFKGVELGQQQQQQQYFQNVSPDLVENRFNAEMPEKPELDYLGNEYYKENQVAVPDLPKQKPFSWSYSVGLLNTFQNIDVNDSKEKLQNFRNPSLFSAKSLGYKFGVGLEYNKWQLNLNYSTIKHWKCYEVATEEVVVTEISPGVFEKSFVGIDVNESASKHYLGFGLKKINYLNEKLLLNVGAEFGLPMSAEAKKTVWTNLEILYSFKNIKGSQLQFGPTFQYNLLNLSATQKEKMTIKDYQLGLVLVLKR